jgi:hypothetical protein
VLEGVPRRLSVLRQTRTGRRLPWLLIAGAVALDLTTLRESTEQRLIIVGLLLCFSLLVYGGVRVLIGRTMENERMRAGVIQLAGFLILFLGTLAGMALLRAGSDRRFAACMALFHGSWALAAVDGYRKGSKDGAGAGAS